MSKIRLNRWKLFWLMVISSILVACSNYYPERAKKTLRVAQAFIDLHRESDVNSQIFYVVERDEVITVVGEGNQFYKIETSDGLQGWISEAEILQTTSLQGRPVSKIKYGILYF